MPRGFSPVDEARLQRRLWTPRELGSNFYAGFSANARETIVTTSGSSVGTWRDFSGNGRNVSTSGTRPTFVENSLNGRPAILFNNSPLLSTATLPAGNNYSWLVLAKDNNAGAPLSEPISTGLSINAGSMEFVLDFDGGVGAGRMAGFNGGVLGRFTSGVPYKTAPTLMAIGVSAGVGRARYNGINGTNGGSGINTTQSLFAIGFSRPQLTYAMNGPIYAVLAIGEIIDSPNYLRAEAWIAWEFGVPFLLPANSPYRNRPPLIGS